jgi:hypothetical protein
MLLMVMEADPLFVRVTTFCAPLPPTATDAQLRLVGDTVAAKPGTARVPIAKQAAHCSLSPNWRDTLDTFPNTRRDVLEGEGSGVMAAPKNLQLDQLQKAEERIEVDITNQAQHLIGAHGVTRLGRLCIDWRYSRATPSAAMRSHRI